MAPPIRTSFLLSVAVSALVFGALPLDVAIKTAQARAANEIQTLTLGGADGGTVTLSFNGTPGTPDLNFTAGASPLASAGRG